MNKIQPNEVAWKVGVHHEASVAAQNKRSVRLGGKEVSVRGGAGLCGRFYSLPWVWLGFGSFLGFGAGDSENAGVLRLKRVCKCWRQLMHHRKREREKKSIFIRLLLHKIPHSSYIQCLFYS